jgi:hypothetical protein
MINEAKAVWKSMAERMKYARMVGRVRLGLPPEPTGWWKCSTCNKWFRKGIHCTYDWSGTCSTGDYDFAIDSPPVISGRGAAYAEVEKEVKKLGRW